MIQRTYNLKNPTGLRWLVLLLAAWLLVSCAPGEQPDQLEPTRQMGTPALNVGDPAPDFTLEAANDGTVTLSEFQGERPVLLYFHMAVG